MTLLLGAFLMFFMQPLAGKLVTPKYGGVAQVWCLCLLFFQSALLGGYSLSYIISKLFYRFQGGLYIGLFVFSLILLNIPTGDEWVPKDPNSPVLSLLPQLIRYLAFPCILLSTVSVLMQNWYRLSGWGDPYYLYSISNIGSLAALAAYPIFVEPHFSVSTTIKIWTCGYTLVTILACISAVILIRRSHGIETKTEAADLSLPDEERPDVYYGCLWTLLSAAGSFLLISFTNHITQDLAPVPLLWVVPLCIYLLSFILCFSNIRFYSQNVFVYPGLILLSVYVCLDLFYGFMGISLVLALVLLFILCMICHGELYEARPRPRYLAVYYLVIALGGALGGVAANFIAPLVFNAYTERYLILGTMLFFLGYLTIHYGLRLFYHRILDKVFLVVILLLTCVLLIDHMRKDDAVVYRERNFYGTVKILKKTLWGEHPMLFLYNGRILHGSQFINKARQDIPTSYFGADSAIGIADHFFRKQNSGVPLKIGVIGLGVGTIAHYGKTGDAITFYEIDPKVKRIAENKFQFLKNTKAAVSILLGDARTSLERQEPQKYDMLIVDAFNGDAIPVHLLTLEALKFYLHHLKEDGLLILHVSNRYLDLGGLTANQALRLGLKGVSMKTKPKARYNSKAKYLVLSRKDWFFEQLNQDAFKEEFPTTTVSELKESPNIGIWTDDYSNLWSVLYF